MAIQDDIIENSIVGLHKGIYSDCEYNPAWGGKYGRVSGVAKKNKGVYHNWTVKWSNGKGNVYSKSDLFIPRTLKNKYDGPDMSYICHSFGSLTYPTLCSTSFGGLSASNIDVTIKSLQEQIKPKTMIQKLSNFITKVVDSDTQALLKVGFINGDLRPTAECWSALNEILFFENKAKLVEKAKELIAEDEAKKK